VDLKGTYFITMEDIKCDVWIQKISKEAFHWCFQQKQEWLQVDVCARVLLWRWLGKHCCMSYHYSAIPLFQEHFDCPSYIKFRMLFFLNSFCWLLSYPCTGEVTVWPPLCKISPIFPTTYTKISKSRI
jgi:hypothetical protein